MTVQKSDVSSPAETFQYIVLWCQNEAENETRKTLNDVNDVAV